MIGIFFEAIGKDLLQAKVFRWDIGKADTPLLSAPADNAGKAGQPKSMINRIRYEMIRMNE